MSVYVCACVCYAAVDWKSGEGEFKLVFKFQWPRVHGFDFCGEVVAVGEQEPDADAAKAATAAGIESRLLSITGPSRLIPFMGVIILFLID